MRPVVNDNSVKGKVDFTFRNLLKISYETFPKNPKKVIIPKIPVVARIKIKLESIHAPELPPSAENNSVICDFLE